MPDPFFIVGNDRSGTTMLRLILDRGPEVAIPPESMFLTDILFADGKADLGTDTGVQALMERVWSHPKVQLWELEGPAPAVPPGLRGIDAYRWVAEAPFLAYARRHGKSGWGDKTPHYVHHVAQLLEIWPRARFVILVRDGRDVGISVRRLPFGPNNTWAAAQWWARGIRAGDRAQAEHPGNVITVRYEDLAGDPQKHVPAICAFLGLEYTPAMLELEHAERSKIVADQKSWFPTLFDGINTAAVNRWEREMSPRQQALFAALAGTELAAHGYPVPATPVQMELSPLRERAFRRHNELMRNVNFLRLRLVQERGRELRYAVARRVRDPIKRVAGSEPAE